MAGDLDLPPHVLRFWESKFPQLKPLKRVGGRRYYRPEDVALLRHIQRCLYREGYTIRGVQKLLGSGGDEAAQPVMPTLFPLDAAEEPAPPAPPPDQGKPARRQRRRQPPPEDRQALEEIRRELLEIRQLLDELLRPKAG